MKLEREITPLRAVNRLDLYFEAHRGLRLSGARLLTRLGALDPADSTAVSRAQRALHDHLVMAESHLKLENAYIHTALEARAPSASAHAAEDHKVHETRFGELRRLLETVLRSAPDAAPQARRLYRAFAAYYGEDLQHMHEEETELLPLLWAHFTDAELVEIRDAIVKSIEPSTRVIYTRAMLAAASEPERVARVTALKNSLRRWQFESLMEGVVGRRWTFGNWRELAQAVA